MHALLSRIANFLSFMGERWSPYSYDFYLLTKLPTKANATGLIVKSATISNPYYQISCYLA